MGRGDSEHLICTNMRDERMKSCPCLHQYVRRIQTCLAHSNLFGARRTGSTGRRSDSSWLKVESFNHQQEIKLRVCVRGPGGSLASRSSGRPELSPADSLCATLNKYLFYKCNKRPTLRHTSVAAVLGLLWFKRRRVASPLPRPGRRF